MANDRYQELKQAEKGAIISIVAYLFISILKLTVGNWAGSEALRADGLNNATDIIASISVLIGLKVSRKPADEDHRYGHWKAETVASLITSLIMIAVGLQVLYSSIQTVLDGRSETPDSIAAIVGIGSASIMYGVYFYNKKLAEKVKSSGLLAAAKDNRSDAWTSIGTAVAVFAATFRLGWLDSLAAVVVGVLIIKTGVDIFRESTFSLSDGFDIELIQQYKEEIEKIPGVTRVKSVKGRNYGANIYVDVVVEMPAEFSVKQSHAIADQIEFLLRDVFGVFEIDVHVEPDSQ
ncbi:cation diffusion facilitator family transporter [Enterococcus camelliae]|uniref:Cation diffusion facilitator family transporter n=1 Tax=Enterococcus camelliae TaxID=453959 RepID=A0ABW5TG06_9ENTE